MFSYEEYQESANYIKEKIGSLNPKIAIILGSGLGVLKDEFEEKIVIKYNEIPIPKMFHVGMSSGFFI